jgi:Lrp/AsnC family leucine-responsive transcriptional regulator
LKKSKKLTKLDMDILKITQKNCKIPLEDIASKLNQSASTIYYRIKQMEKNSIIRGYYTDIDPAKLGKNFWGLIRVRAKYGPKYHEIVAKKLAEIKDIQKIYFIWGDWDFLTIVAVTGNDDLLRILNEITSMKEVERTSTYIVAKVVKDEVAIPI